MWSNFLNARLIIHLDIHLELPWVREGSHQTKASKPGRNIVKPDQKNLFNGYKFPQFRNVTRRLVIFLDFHSTKHDLPLVDSWSHGID